MRITTNGTTITGSLSEVLATLTHITQITSKQEVTAEDAKPVTTVNVSGTMVTTEEAKEIAKSIVAKLHADERVLTKAEAVATPKLTRDDVIQQAIDDVKDLLSRNHTRFHEDGEESNRIASHVGQGLWFSSEGGKYAVCHGVRFVVNADKRTVVAIVDLEKHNAEISKGRAKCAPNDVFNEHIGKAIALRRALGLEVPVEYFEVANRTQGDLAVGDVVRGDTTGYIFELTAEKRNPLAAFVPGKAFDIHDGKWVASSQVTLINDSARHTAPDLEVSRIIRH